MSRNYLGTLTWLDAFIMFFVQGPGGILYGHIVTKKKGLIETSWWNHKQVMTNGTQVKQHNMIVCIL